MLTKSQIIKHLQTQNNRPDFHPLRQAAVFIPLVETEAGISFLFEVRAAHLKWQPGDICFPGGKVELTDTSTHFTALRETQEELGLGAQDIKIYYELPPFFTVLGLEIYPVIGEIVHPEHIKINQQEVESIFTVPISWFMANPPIKADMLVATKPAGNFPLELLKNRDTEWQQRSSHEVYLYPYQHHVIWGLTAQIIVSCLSLFNAI
ncbi:CoA pyrophosphatase [Utexia brackfieldae]|uniref:NUDIX hydrolase n=1 Tax=Utexia brackfieldae TaxID=3074108 RepID=UPI00370D8326